MTFGPTPRWIKTSKKNKRIDKYIDFWQLYIYVSIIISYIFPDIGKAIQLFLSLLVISQCGKKEV